MAWAVPFNKDVVLFADQGQYELGAGILTPKTAAILRRRSTRQVRPPGNHRHLRLLRDGQDGYTQVTNIGTTGRAPANGRVQHHRTFSLHPDRHLQDHRVAQRNVVAVLTLSDPNAICTTTGDPTAASSWTRWDMGGMVAVEFIKADLWMVIQRNGSTWLEDSLAPVGSTLASSHIGPQGLELDLTGATTPPPGSPR